MTEEWRQRAGCRGKNPDYFMVKNVDLLHIGHEICWHECDVRSECLESQLQREGTKGEAARDQMLYGGYKPRARAKIARDRAGK